MMANKLFAPAVRYQFWVPAIVLAILAMTSFSTRNVFEATKEIKRPLHPKHPLSLQLAEPLPLYSRCVCDLCKKTCMRLVYRCPLCAFDLDIQCAFLLCINYEEGRGHQAHQFIPLRNSLSFKSLSFSLWH